MSEYTYPQVAFHGDDEVDIRPTPRYDSTTPLNSVNLPLNSASTPLNTVNLPLISATTPLNSATTPKRAESRGSRRCDEGGFELPRPRLSARNGSYHHSSSTQPTNQNNRGLKKAMDTSCGWAWEVMWVGLGQ